MCAYVCEINDSNEKREEGKELKLFCYYNVPHITCEIIQHNVKLELNWL